MTIAIALAATFARAAAPGPEALGWGLASGLGAGFGSLLLYRGLGRGPMGIVAPLSALGAAVLPVFVGVVLGDRPSTSAWLGILFALPAIWLVSTSSDDSAPAASRHPSSWRTNGVVDGLLAGVAFAVLFVGLKLAGAEAGLWPVFASQLG